MTARLRASASYSVLCIFSQSSTTACCLKYTLVDFASSSFQNPGLTSIAARWGGGVLALVLALVTSAVTGTIVIVIVTVRVVITLISNTNTYTNFYERK